MSSHKLAKTPGKIIDRTEIKSRLGQIEHAIVVHDKQLKGQRSVNTSDLLQIQALRTALIDKGIITESDWNKYAQMATDQMRKAEVENERRGRLLEYVRSQVENVADVIPNPYLPDDNKFVVLNIKGEVLGLTWFDKQDQVVTREDKDGTKHEKTIQVEVRRFERTDKIPGSPDPKTQPTVANIAINPSEAKGEAVEATP